MGTNTEEHMVSRAGSEVTYQAMVGSEIKETPHLAAHKLIAENSKSNSMVMKGTLTEISPPKQKPHKVIPAHIIAEAISMIRDIDLRWSGPITQKEIEYVEQYVLAKYPEYAGLIEGDGIDMSTFVIHKEPSSSEPILEDRRKSPRGSTTTTTNNNNNNNLPELDRTQLEPSRLLDILTKKSSFPGSFISIPEIQAQNKVLKHCGLPDDEYLVLFTPSHKDAMMLVGESYPFKKGSYYMTILEEAEDYIREFACFKESKVIVAPKTWLDLRIRGSQLSQNFRRKCKVSPKGMFSYPADVNGTMHWVSEAHRNSWHVLLDASGLVVGRDRLHLALHRPDFVVCSLENTNSSGSGITCLLVRKKSFDSSSS
ncbi:molybdenum cofactor sulfurase [Senna tora]|uniref:Molybdenum cofactor sulfurase n=1 Tax=Senna tora TaxID=362788 RepID=A0A834X663_9FABA|nr:molybdenum cofactor sulfurase [Senna tora]